MARFCSYGGGISASAYIGGNPEHRDWKPGDEVFEPEIDLTARIEPFVSVDSGYSAHTVIGARTWLLKHSHVGHDAVIGCDCEIACGAVVGGSCIIGDRVKIGLNAVILPFVKIGDSARIGAGAIVTKDVPPGEIWVGNPARCLREATEFGTDGQSVARINAS